jgi:hypothetical protein
MQLNDKNVSDFQKLYKELYNIGLSKGEAYDKGLRILNLVKLIYKPMSKSEFAKIRCYFKEWESEIAELEAMGKC